VRTLILAAALGCAVGCVRKPIYVAPADVHDQLAALRRQGHAEVETTPSGSFELHMDQRVEVRVPHGGLIGRFIRDSQTLTVAELIDHCPVEAIILAEHRRETCVLQEVSAPFQVGTRLRPDGELWGMVGTGAVGAGGILGLGYCASECFSPWDTASMITLGAIVVGGIIVFGPFMR
jgi:hypothetical protein